MAQNDEIERHYIFFKPTDQKKYIYCTPSKNLGSNDPQITEIQE
jgi:hypothetical protein